MKTLGTKPLSLALVMAALLLGVSSQAFGYSISVWPDTVTMSAGVGSSSDAYIIITDGRDTMQQNQTPGSVFVSLSGNSQFTMLTDSVLNFIGETVIQIRYSPTSNYAASAQVRVQGDSNTAYVQVVGNPTHFTPSIQFQLGNYDSLGRSQSCQDFGVYNPNPDAITVTQILVTDNANGQQWSVENVHSLPVSISSHTSLTLGQLCALLGTDSSDIFGSMEIDYTYDNSSYSGTTDLSGYGRPVDATCVTSDGVISVALPEGQSDTGHFDLTNNTNASVTLDSAEISGSGSGQFALVSPSFPLTLAAGASQTVNISASMPNNPAQNNYDALFSVAVQGTSRDNVPCNAVYVSLHAEDYLIDVDSITLDVPPGSTSLSITAHSTRSRHAIFIQNTGSSHLLLQTLSVSTADTSVAYAYFGNYGETTTNLYDSLGAGQSTGMNGPIDLTLQAADTGTYTLNLTLTYEVMQAHQKGDVPASSSYTYSVVAHRLPPVTEGVSEPNAPAAMDFTLSPNPAQDEVTIGLPNNGKSTVEVYDVLGNLVMSRMAQGEFVWSGTSNTGALANGTYIVRVSQGSYTSSKRLVIVR